MPSSKPIMVITAVSLVAGCYHATIETGAPPATQTVQNDWASGWIWGLVPPKTVSTAATCPNGVSKVETQQTFLNGLVHLLTVGIYTPMAIKATCASGPVAPAAEPAPAQ
jgi:hypothetical protein